LRTPLPIDGSPPVTATAVEDSRPRLNPAAQQLIQKVNLDLAEPGQLDHGHAEFRSPPARSKGLFRLGLKRFRSSSHSPVGIDLMKRKNTSRVGLLFRRTMALSRPKGTGREAFARLATIGAAFLSNS